MSTVSLTAIKETHQKSQFSGQFDILHIYSDANREESLKAIFEDLKRSLFLLGYHRSFNTIKELMTFLEENNLLSIADGYLQAISDPVNRIFTSAPALLPGLLLITTRLESNIPVRGSTNAIISSASIVSNEEDASPATLTGAANGIVLLFQVGDDAVQYVIPAEIFMVAKKPSATARGFEFTSMAASNQLLKAIREYQPNLTREPYVYYGLQVYGLDLIEEVTTKGGKKIARVNFKNLELAILEAEKENTQLKEAYYTARESFKKLIDENRHLNFLQEIVSLVEAHAIIDKTELDLREGAPALCIPTEMAITIYSDILAIVQGQKTWQDCPQLQEAVKYCGDPVLAKKINLFILKNAQKCCQGKLKELQNNDTAIDYKTAEADYKTAILVSTMKARADGNPATTAEAANHFLQEVTSCHEAGCNPELLTAGLTCSTKLIYKDILGQPLEVKDKRDLAHVCGKLWQDPTTRKLVANVLMISGCAIGGGLVLSAVIVASLVSGGVLPAAAIAALATAAVVGKVLFAVNMSSFAAGLGLNFWEEKRIEQVQDSAKKLVNELSPKELRANRSSPKIANDSFSLFGNTVAKATASVKNSLFGFVDSVRNIVPPT